MLQSSDQQKLQIYIFTVSGEWLLLYLVWRAVRARGVSLMSLSGRWRSWSQIATSAVVGIVLAGAVLGADAFLNRLTGSGSTASIDALLPQTPPEIVAWIAVALTAGIVEELVFRGYLLQQLSYRCKSVPIAVIAQGLWFGGMHAYEGPRNVVSICVLGIVFGMVAVRRRNLLTNMVAHTSIDLVEGLLPRLF